MNFYLLILIFFSLFLNKIIFRWWRISKIWIRFRKWTMDVPYFVGAVLCAACHFHIQSNSSSAFIAPRKFQPTRPAHSASIPFSDGLGNAHLKWLLNPSWTHFKQDLLFFISSIRYFVIMAVLSIALSYQARLNLKRRRFRWLLIIG